VGRGRVREKRKEERERRREREGERGRESREHSGYTGILATAGAGVAGATAHHVVTFPAYAVRDHLGPHAMHSSPREIAQCITQHKRALFKGWGRSLLRAVPEGALTFVVYEAALSPKEAKEAMLRSMESTRAFLGLQ